MDTQRDLIGYVLAGRYRLTTRLGLGASDEPRGMFDALDIRTNVAVRVRLTPLNDLVDARSL
ncbi:MAG: hypothetical protein FGM42_11430, partial [Ilumatobacteraceae bacterium]|nr:hypothetical protein [Ilumatobacteraceae bacterium]